MPAEAVVRHRETAELCDHVLAPGDIGDVAFPFVEDRIALARVRPDTEGRPEVIEDDRRVRHRACELDELLDLEVVVPRVVGVAPLTEPGDAGTERGINR